MKQLLLVVIIMAHCLPILAQEQKGQFFMHWGYNRSAYTTSNIHFKSSDYEFVIKDALAHDRQSTFDPKLYFSPKTLTIPQYVYRIGYFINDKWSISLGMDHMKYVFDNEQTAVVDGFINQDNGAGYSGQYDNELVQIDRGWLEFEHSDGLNYLSAEANYNVSLAQFANQKMRWTIGGGGGTGIYIPKTKVKLFGVDVDNNFHMAGFGFSAQARTRLYFFDHLYVELAAKSGWAFLPDVLINGTADARINHNFGWVQYNGSLGYQFGVKKKK